MADKIAKLEKPFRNRVIGSGVEQVDQLLANPRNWRIHPDFQQQALAGGIDEIGYIRSVTVNQTTGAIVDGHLRVMLALRSGVAELPVEYVELNEEEEAKALLMLDPIAAMAASDRAKLTDLMREVNSDDARVQAMLAELAEKEGILGNGHEPADAEPQVDRAGELQQVWHTATGQLWHIGEHRLLCGDSTKREDVERVMGEEEPGILVNDPPYGIDLDTDYTQINPQSDKHAEFEKAKGKTTNKHYAPVIGDNANFDPSFLMGLFSNVQEQFWWGADYYVERLIGKNEGSWLVWDKRQNEGDGDYTLDDMFGSAFELCWSRQRHKRDIIRARFAGLFGTETQDVKERLHPTQKALQVIAWILERYSKEGSIVFDGFLGSGTTMVACQNLGRKCRGIEISESYTAVCLQRMLDAFNIRGELVE